MAELTRATDNPRTTDKLNRLRSLTNWSTWFADTELRELTHPRHETTFICEGCGWIVHDFGLTSPPAHGYCSVCAFLDEFVWRGACRHMDEFWSVYRHVMAERDL